MDMMRKGPWTQEEDSKLRNYVAIHGEGHWSSLSRSAGLKRSGKSCRLRWLNYLKPDVRRGNITLQEQLLILELNLRMGNRWSKIAKHLPGRTDNDIKNYWRTKVKKQAKQLKCDVSSQKFKDTLRYVWMPRLAEQIQLASSSPSSASSKATAAPPITTVDHSTNITTGHLPMTELSRVLVDPLISPDLVPPPSKLLADSSSKAQDSAVWAQTSCYDFVGNYSSCNFQDGNFYSLESEAGSNSTSSGERLEIKDSNTLLSGEDSLEIFPQFDDFWELPQPQPQPQPLYYDQPTLY